MKKLLLFATTVLLAASSVDVAVAKQSVNANESATEAVVSAGPRVYSNCYDGYLNVRAQPTTQSQIVGRLDNGPEGAELLGVEGGWSKVRVNGVEGYVSSKYLQSTPTDSVYIDASVVVGKWAQDFGLSNAYDILTILSNGKFVQNYYEMGQGGKSEGTWRLSGSGIYLTYSEGYTVGCSIEGDTLIKGGFEYYRQ
jgi:hypothetical protein